MKQHRSEKKILQPIPKALSPAKNLASNQQSLIQHRKQIQSTLNELHRLQSQIYELNVPENPHSSSPVKKQIRQLSYLYENMTKPKVKNNLNVKSQDIQLALRVMNKDWNSGVTLQPEIVEQKNNVGNASSEINLLTKNKTFLQTGMISSSKQIKKKANQDVFADKSYKTKKQTLKEKFEGVTQNPLNLDFISKNQKSETVSTKQLYSFINFTDCEDLDPIEEAYKMFLNQNGQFDFTIYNNFNQILGLPKIKSINTFISAINYNNKQQNDEKDLQKVGKTENSQLYTPSSVVNISFEQFKKVLDFQI